MWRSDLLKNRVGDQMSETTLLWGPGVLLPKTAYQGYHAPHDPTSIPLSNPIRNLIRDKIGPSMRCLPFLSFTVHPSMRGIKRRIESVDSGTSRTLGGKSYLRQSTGIWTGSFFFFWSLMLCAQPRRVKRADIQTVFFPLARTKERGGKFFSNPIDQTCMMANLGLAQWKGVAYGTMW